MKTTRKGTRLGFSLYYALLFAASGLIVGLTLDIISAFNVVFPLTLPLFFGHPSPPLVGLLLLGS